MENKLSKLKRFKQVTLNDEERNLLRAHAANIIIATPVLVTESFFKRGVQHGLRIALSSMLFIVFIAGSVSAVANNALPGDPLYSFKLNVNEKVKGIVLGTDPQQQVLLSGSLLTKRFNEIQVLAQSNSLTSAKQKTVENAINNNVANLSANLDTLSKQSPTAALSVTASLEQTLKASKAALENTPTDSTADNSGKQAAIATVNATLQQVSNQEVQILSKEIDGITTEVNNTSTSASGTTDTSVQSSTQTSTTTTQTPATPVTPVAP